MNNLKWFLAGVLLVVAIAGYLNRGALDTYREQVSAKEIAEQRLQKAELERAKLLERQSELETSMGQEKQARKNGYRKPGEKPLFGP